MPHCYTGDSQVFGSLSWKQGVRDCACMACKKLEKLYEVGVNGKLW